MSPPVPILTYATPAPRRRWGPIFFAPSRASLLCFAVAALAWVWLYFRHTAWREFMTIEQGSQSRRGRSYSTPTSDPPRFTPDNLLITSDAKRGTELWDPASGHRVRSVAPGRIAPERFFDRNARFLIPSGEPGAGLYNTITGDRVGPNRPPRQGPPATVPNTSSSMSADGTRILDVALFRSSSEPGHLAIDVQLVDVHDPADGPPRRIAQIDRATGTTAMTPDSRVLIAADGGDILVRDLTDGRLLVSTPLGISGANWIQFLPSADSSRFAILTSKDNGLCVQIRAVANARLLTQFWRPAFSSCEFSPNLDRALIQLLPRASELEVVDTATGQALARRDWDAASPYPLADGRRFVSYGDDLRTHLFDLNSLRRIASFDPGAVMAWDLTLSPGGNSIAGRNHAGNVAVFRRTGPDCPESVAGIFAFPHLYLFAIAFAAAAIYLARDARRRGDRAATDAVLPTLRWSPAVLLVAAGLLTAHDLLRVALGFGVNWAAPERLIAGPVLLLAAWHLPTRSRFWRYVSIALLLAALVPIGLATRAALASSFAPIVPLLDTTIAVPRAVFIASMTVAIGAALAMVAEIATGRRRAG
ncbi:MAG: WD40 repeat domain-containing protein [Phycisphaerae bacterium]|nr:hypothetical protein [Tepidisphaeraceae bacterium]